jgi:hypothetical protein
MRVRSYALATVGLLVVVMSASRLLAADVAAIDIGSRRELFVDHHLIARIGGAQLVLQRPQPAEAALRFDQPWEGPFCGYVTVIKDGKKYLMYYRGLSELKDDSNAECTCYAESRDGIRWKRPSLRLYEMAGTRDNNVILAGQAPASHNFTPFLDTNPNAGAAQRFKAVCGSMHSGLMAYVSADGIHWNKLRPEPLLTAGAFDSQNVVFWSESEKCYVCYFRTWSQGGASGKAFAGARTISRATSQDFLTWGKPVVMDLGGGPVEELYTSQTHPYFRAPHIYVAFPMRFFPGRTAFSDTAFAKISPSVPAGYLKSARADCSDGLFMTSRGGNRYDRTFREAFFRPGLDPSNWVSRSIMAFPAVVPTGRNEMSIYYHQHDGQKSAHVVRCTLRLDGFTSVKAPYTGGELLTKPLVFTGKRLEINYSTSAAGSIRVEVQNAAGRPISGFALGDCREIIGDQIERIVEWRSGSDVSALAGQPVRLRFVMKDADLYSLRFRPE